MGPDPPAADGRLRGLRPRYLLTALLCFQAFALFWRLDLLPAWADEMFTLQTVAHPVREIVPIVQKDIHPPLYYVLLHFWDALPLPWAGIAKLRAFSAGWALACTVLLDCLWTRRLAPPVRWFAVSMLALSPCLLLYGRMARSYSMQAALVLLALGLLHRWLLKPDSIGLSCGAGTALVALLYTHYAPGIALLAGFVLVAWRVLGAARVTVFTATVSLMYLPWAITLIDALHRWSAAAGFSSRYTITGNVLLEQAAKLGYGAVSLTIGESFLALSLMLVPVVLLLVFAGLLAPQFPARLAAMLTVAGIVGYLGVARWVSYPFIPARLLWLLPFACIAAATGGLRIASPWARYGVTGLIIVSYLSSMVLYFRRDGFLNHGYTVPLAEIAAMLNRESRPGDLILLDAYNTDYAVLCARLSGQVPSIVLDESGVPAARDRIGSARTVWMVRNTHDVSPAHVDGTLEQQSCEGRERRVELFEPYPPWQRAAMKLARIDPVPTHFYRVTVCSPPTSASSIPPFSRRETAAPAP